MASSQNSCLFATYSLRNAVYYASRELNNIYRVLVDADAEDDGDLRVIDERRRLSISAERYILVSLPQDLEISPLKTD